MMKPPSLAALQTLRGTRNSSLTACARTSSRLHVLRQQSRKSSPRTRFYSTENPSAGSGSSSSAPPPASGGSNSRIRVSSLFTVLLCVGLGATAFGLYDVYSTLTMWPEDIRQDLRAAITAKNQGFFETSARYYQRALETAKALPLSTWGSNPYLKLTGIYIALAETQEEQQVPAQAYETYKEALTMLEKANASSGSGSGPGLSGTERLRGVALAMRLGEMAEMYGQPEEEEERWLSLAVNWVLKIAQEEQGQAHLHGGDGKKPSSTATLDVSDLSLPSWVSSTDISAPLSALGAFYSRTGKIEYAMPLYLHAISALIPPAAQNKAVPPERLCQGAQLMTSLSELIIRQNVTPEKLHQSEVWAQKALAILQKATASAAGAGNGEIDTCEEALVFAYFNLASVLEMKGENESAEQLFKKSLLQAKKVQMKEGITEATLALRRIGRVERAASRPSHLP